MPLALSAQPRFPEPAAFVASVDRESAGHFQRAFETDAIRSEVTEIRIGNLTYPLRTPCPAHYLPVHGELIVEGFSPVFIGQGASADEALQNWIESVHSSFQELVHRRPFEMSDEDRRRWQVLSARIDVAVYRNTTPLVMRELGRIGRIRSQVRELHWENGQHERVRIEQVDTPDFIAFKVGQPFEAIVERDPLDLRLLRIIHIVRRSTPTHLTGAEKQELLEAMGSSSSLPDADWD